MRGRQSGGWDLTARIFLKAKSVRPGDEVDRARGLSGRADPPELCHCSFSRVNPKALPSESNATSSIHSGLSAAEA